MISFHQSHFRHLETRVIRRCPPGSAPGAEKTASAFVCSACQAGLHSPIGRFCLPCPPDFFTPFAGQRQCLPCPKSYRTEKIGAQSRTDCIYAGALPFRWFMLVRLHRDSSFDPFPVFENVSNGLPQICWH